MKNYIDLGTGTLSYQIKGQPPTKASGTVYYKPMGRGAKAYWERRKRWKARKRRHYTVVQYAGILGMKLTPLQREVLLTVEKGVNEGRTTIPWR